MTGRRKLLLQIGVAGAFALLLMTMSGLQPAERIRAAAAQTYNFRVYLPEVAKDVIP